MRRGKGFACGKALLGRRERQIETNPKGGTESRATQWEVFSENWIFSEKVKPHTADLGVSAVNWNQPAVLFVAAKLLLQ